MNRRRSIGDEVYVDDLTWREQEVLILLAERLTNREVAGRLHLAESTVKDYVGKIFSKLYVKNRREAVERAKSLGLLDADRKSAPRPQINLPAEPNPFVGRENEIREVKRQLAQTRLLTLSGPGGMGKTRLALKAAREMTADFADGVFFIPLAPIRSVDNLVQTIAEAVRFPLATQEDPQHQLLRYLKRKQLLLVMDNFEHLLDGVGIVSQMIQTAPSLKVLATSREKLNLQSETNLNIGGMHSPDKAALEDPLNSDAVTLFIQRACMVQPGFDPSPDELKQITKICQIVEGMPLAIELAAAWLHILTVTEIAAELKQGFDFLATEARDAPQRHRSVRTVFDHSWTMLEPVERQVFMRLSVFRGGFTRQAAQQVTGASLQQLVGLLNKSFLSSEPATGRLEVHELLRQYAQERLEQDPQVALSAQDAHAVYFADFMQEGWARLRDSRQLTALAEIEADIENVRAAWRFHLDRRNIQQAWKFIYTLWHVYYIRWWNHAGMELFAQAVRALDGVEGDQAAGLRALAAAFQSYFMAFLGLADKGYQLAQESLPILRQFNRQEPLIFAYDCLILNAYFINRFAEQIEWINKMRQSAMQVEDPWFEAFMLYAASLGALVMEDFAQAKKLAESELEICEQIGDVIGSTLPLIALGHVAFAGGENEEARDYYLRCMEISERFGFHYAIQTSSKYLSKVYLRLGEFSEAEKYLLQSLKISNEIGFVRDVVNLFFEYARLQAARDQTLKAVELLALVIQHPASDQNRMLEGRIRDSARELLARLENELPPADFHAAFERGQKLNPDEVVMALVSRDA